jgi:hypothetical protein
MYGPSYKGMYVFSTSRCRTYVHYSAPGPATPTAIGTFSRRGPPSQRGFSRYQTIKRRGCPASITKRQRLTMTLTYTAASLHVAYKSTGCASFWPNLLLHTYVHVCVHTYVHTSTVCICMYTNFPQRGMPAPRPFHHASPLHPEVTCNGIVWDTYSSEKGVAGAWDGNTYIHT